MTSTITKKVIEDLIASDKKGLEEYEKCAIIVKLKNQKNENV